MPTTINVKIIADSVCNGDRVTTLLATYHRYIHSELMTHRDFSRNAASSRAIPVSKILRRVWSDPAIPIHWGKNQKGMQAEGELTGFRRWLCRHGWTIGGKIMCILVWCLMKLGLHKQVANRLLEPWQWMTTLITSTEWENFYELRCHKDAQPEFQDLAKKIRAAREENKPEELREGQWHLPFVEVARDANAMAFNQVWQLVPSGQQRDLYFWARGTDNYAPLWLEEALIASTACCARTSYLTMESKAPTMSENRTLHARLVGSYPRHSSPTEHACRAVGDGAKYFNLRGWKSYRWQMERESC